MRKHWPYPSDDGLLLVAGSLQVQLVVPTADTGSASWSGPLQAQLIMLNMIFTTNRKLSAPITYVQARLQPLLVPPVRHPSPS